MFPTILVGEVSLNVKGLTPVHPHLPRGPAVTIIQVLHSKCGGLETLREMEIQSHLVA